MYNSSTHARSAPQFKSIAELRPANVSNFPPRCAVCVVPKISGAILKNDDFVLKNGHSFCNSRYRLDPNGFAGEPNPQPRASFNSTVHLSNGGVFKAHRRERHQVLFDPQTHEPVALFNVDPQAIPATM